MFSSWKMVSILYYASYVHTPSSSRYIYHVTLLHETWETMVTLLRKLNLRMQGMQPHSVVAGRMLCHLESASSPDWLVGLALYTGMHRSRFAFQRGRVGGLRLKFAFLRTCLLYFMSESCLLLVLSHRAALGLGSLLAFLSLSSTLLFPQVSYILNEVCPLIFRLELSFT